MRRQQVSVPLLRCELHIWIAPLRLKMADDGGGQRIRSERQRASTSKSATQPFLHPGPLLSGQGLQLRPSSALHFTESVNREQERWRRSCVARCSKGHT